MVIALSSTRIHNFSNQLFLPPLLFSVLFVFYHILWPLLHGVGYSMYSHKWSILSILTTWTGTQEPLRPPKQLFFRLGSWKNILYTFIFQIFNHFTFEVFILGNVFTKGIVFIQSIIRDKIWGKYSKKNYKTQKNVNLDPVYMGWGTPV